MTFSLLRTGAALGLGALLFASCKPNLTADAPSAGSADFSRYLAVGNSLTAGYADNSLYKSGQENSYPSFLARQFAAAGGGAFKQPLLPGESGYPSAKLMLKLMADCQGTVALSPQPVSQTDTAGNAASVAAQGPYNNLGVPGIRCIDYLVPSYGFLNPYAKRFFSTILTNPFASPVTEVANTAATINPTFFTLWIGNNDVLGYATSGGSGKSSGGSFTDQNAISSQALFQVAFDSVFNTVTRNGAKGLVIGIPDVTAIPYFTTVPIRGLALTRQGQADSLNANYAALINAGLVTRFAVGANAFIIQDTSAAGGPVKRRSIRDGEYLTLTVPQDSIKCRGWGSTVPIPIRYVLDAAEVSAVRSATTSFNGYMSARAAAKGLPFVDIGAYLKTIASGIIFNGVSYNTTFVTGGTFSLDGVHLTPRGYALVANYFIQTINDKWGSSVPALDINQYSGVRFP